MSDASLRKLAVEFTKQELSSGKDWQEIGSHLLNTTPYERLFDGLCEDEADCALHAIINDAEGY